MSKNTDFQICDAKIKPGEKASLALPLPEQYSCAPLYMPIKVIHGKQAGPIVLVFSTVDGNELNGLEIVNRLVNELDPAELNGTVIAIPVLNIYGLTHYPKTSPSGISISQSFPGTENGRYNERIAYIFTQEILKQTHYCVELQTGAINHDILPQMYCNLDDAESKNLARVFQTPVITHVANKKDTSLRKTAEDLNLPLFVYQAGEAVRFNECAIQTGQKGILNFLCHLEMLAGEPDTSIQPVVSRDEDWLTAPKGGILHPKVELGQVINKGDTIAQISDPFGADIIESLTATMNGVVVGINRSPLIHEGLSIFKVATFLDNEKAESIINDWDEQQDNV